MDRINESARKRDKVARANEERQKRHLDGYQTPDEHQNKRKMPGKSLLVQQLQYDDEMEDQATEKGQPLTLGDLHQPSVDDYKDKDKLLEQRRSAS